MPWNGRRVNELPGSALFIMPHLLKEKILKTVITVFLFGGGLWLLATSGSSVLVEQKLQQSSAVVEGRVIDGSSRRLSKGGQSLRLVVEYVPAGHGPITRTFDVDTGDYQEAMASRRARVTYHPADPEVSRVTQFAMLPNWVVMGLGAFMVVAGLICLRCDVKTSRSSSAAA